MVLMKIKVVREQVFTIKELESFSGIKAHTIRIWEQRYNLLKPDRTDTNIRRYTDQDLKKLLNISLLLNLGYKISGIAKLSDSEIQDTILKSQVVQGADQHHQHVLKIAMLNYDEILFNSVIDPFVAQNGIQRTFVEVIIPFLHSIGVMWQADAICPAQEHFISSLIRQKLFSLIEGLKDVPTTKEKTLILFLPELEIHEISLIMLQYVFKSRGYKTIFLGQSVPIDDLVQVYQRMGAVHFVSILTTNPMPILLNDYMKKISKLFTDSECHFHFTGFIIKGQKSIDFQLISYHNTVEELMSQFD
jgi:DNA-binding transcriptional MerR regulator